MGARHAPHRILIRGGTVVAHTGTGPADVLVEGERIAGIGDFDSEGADMILEASDRLVIPGAAACGGTTTILDFATAYRGETPADGLAAWHAKAQGKAMVDYGFHMSLTELAAPADDIVAEMVEAGGTSFKLYMTYSDRLMVSDSIIAEGLPAAG